MLLENKKKYTILKSLSSLTILQISNYTFPLITFPYLVRVIGPEKFGLYNFAAAFVAYFGLLTDYGFNLSAVREISANRDNNNLYRIFNSVLTVKVILLLLCTVIFLLIITIIPQFSRYFEVYFISYIFIIGTVLFPLWFFQGMEEMKYITLINVIIKSLSTLLIFLVIKKESDFVVLLIINSLSSAAMGFIGLFVAVKKFKIPLYIPSYKEIKLQFKSSWYEFISIISISLYTVSNTFILGLFAGNIPVGFFAGADKIRIALQGLFSVLLQAVYPHISYLFSKSKTEGLKFAQKLLKLIIIPGALITLFLIAFAERIVLIVLGPQYMNSILPLKILAVLPFVIILSNIFGIHVMLNMGYKKAFMQIVALMGFFNLLISFILVPRFLEVGTSLSMAFVEIMVTLCMYIYLKKQGVNFFKKFV